MDFVGRIDFKLTEKNIKRAAMCQDIGIDTSIITAWKKRGTIPAGDVCLKIADYLGVSVEWLITGKEKEDVKTENITVSKMENALKKINALTQDFFNAVQETLKERRLL